jgi:hypothetical protein
VQLSRRLGRSICCRSLSHSSIFVTLRGRCELITDGGQTSCFSEEVLWHIVQMRRTEAAELRPHSGWAGLQARRDTPPRSEPVLPVSSTEVIPRFVGVIRRADLRAAAFAGHALPISRSRVNFGASIPLGRRGPQEGKAASRVFQRTASPSTEECILSKIGSRRCENSTAGRRGSADVERPLPRGITAAGAPVSRLDGARPLSEFSSP